MAASFGAYSTRELMRVARAVTPSAEIDNWTLTAGDRMWRQQGDAWLAVNANGTPIKEYGYSVTVWDADMREHVINQLERYGVAPDGWQIEAH